MNNKRLEAALRSISAEFDRETLEWLAGMYDGESGGFYYAESSRVGDQYEPDLESTAQATSLLHSLGLISKDQEGKTDAPSWWCDGIYEFFAARQDERDGYFYDPVYREISAKDKKERNTVFSVGCLESIGRRAPYPTPMERIRAAGGSSSDKDQAMYESRESIRAWLDGLKATRPNSYYWGSDISSARSMIKASGRLGDVVEWLVENQNPENGTWEKEFDLTAVNGVLKISGFFGKETVDFPCYETYLSRAIEFTKTFSPYSAASAWNPMGSIKRILRSLETPPSEQTTALIDNGIIEMIENTHSKMREFRQPDHGFGYSRKGSSAISNSVKVSDGLPEGDVNALALMVLILKESYDLSGTPMPLLWRGYRDEFFAALYEKRKPYIKES